MKEYITILRQESRKLIRELGLLHLNQPQKGLLSSSHWHALIEIHKEPGITLTALSKILVLSISTISRIVDALVAKGYVKVQEGIDKREKSLVITSQGLREINHIDAFSNPRIIGALDYLSSEDQQMILGAIKKYADALEKSRLEREGIKIHTLPSSRPIRNQIIHMIESIQKNEFSIPITPDINACILKAEETFHYNNQCNFWYATNAAGHIIGSIGLKRMDMFNGEIKKFFVHQDYRGKGTANKLIQKMLQAAQKNGFHTLYLGTVSLLKAAQKFYEKAGFQQIEKDRLPMEFEVCPLDSVFFRGSVREIAAYSIDE